MTPALLLAAGASQRLGRPKALLPYRGSSLIEHAAETLLAAGCQPVLVVLGAEKDKARARVKGLPVGIVECDDAKEGLSASIRAGVEALATAAPDAAGLLLALVDQPLVTAGLLERLIEAGREGGLAASDYGEAIGPPAYFAREYFTELTTLRGDRGAKRILQAHRNRLRLVEFPGGALDVDRSTDYERLLSGS